MGTGQVQGFGDGMAFFSDGGGQGLAAGMVGLHDHLVGGAINLNARLGIHPVQGLLYCAFAVAAGHAGDSKNVFHRFSSFKILQQA